MPKGEVSRPRRTEGTNRELIANALASWKMPKVDTKDPQAIEQRISDYLQYCMDTDVPPSVAGCANWLGVTVPAMGLWYTGQRGTPEHQRVVSNFYGFLQEVWAHDMHDGNINPVSGIFMGKVFFGYKDSQEIVIKQNGQNEISTDDLIAESKLLPGAEQLALPSGSQTFEEEPKINGAEDEEPILIQRTTFEHPTAAERAERAQNGNLTRRQKNYRTEKAQKEKKLKKLEKSLDNLDY